MKKEVRTMSIGRFALLDAVLLAVACLVPTVSHLFAVPLYMLNPMLAILLAGVLLGRDWRNSVLLAVLLPAVSCMLVGMPTVGKMFCMMAELSVVAGGFHLLSRQMKAFPAVLIAAVVGKVVYYALKAAIVAPAVMVGTAWTWQAVAVLLWGGLFALLYRKG